MDQRSVATQVVESLRRGIPPQRGVELYSVGNEKLIEGIKNRHLNNIGERGIIRFVSGSWGAGKTHFFRQLREVAFQNELLVSNVELGVNNAALNKFESIFSAVVRQIATPSFYAGYCPSEAAPFGTVVRESLAWLSTGKREIPNEVSYEQFSKAVEALMSDHGIDIDFKKMVQEYWKTFLPESPDPAIVEQTRGEILQWFSGEGSISAYRKRFDVSKVVKRENARLILQSLNRFVRLSGYNGFLILFDEVEQSYSVMRKSALRGAHDNLKFFIDNIESLPGLFLIYATTADFFMDAKHGIVIYGALATRIGKPEQRSPRALDTIWNLDAVQTTLEDYQTAATKIRSVYIQAYPEAAALLPDESNIKQKVSELFRMHPSFAAIRFWRPLVTALVTDFDDHLEGETRPTKKLYDDVMNRLRED